MKVNRKKMFRFLWSVMVEYETQKVVKIHSRRIGAIFRLIQLGIIAYVIGWVMYKEKGYQQFDHAVSGVMAKVRGVTSNLEIAHKTDHEIKDSITVYDSADYVVPPMQKAAFFVMTNLVETPAQQLKRCDEMPRTFNGTCQDYCDCKKGDIVLLGSGIKTGRCIPSRLDSTAMVCEIYGWCPTEDDQKPEHFVLRNAPNFTVILKNVIEFPLYKIKRRNILPSMDRRFLHSCRYDPKDATNKYCPVFRLGDILKYAEADENQLFSHGGMVSIHIEWNCDLDYGEEHCLPKYIFSHLDDFDSKVGRGLNFRFSQHYLSNGVPTRNLVKAFGIQFFVTVYGKGGKFHLLNFSMNLGSGLALLGIATVLCDMIILNTTRNRNFYRDVRVDKVTNHTLILNSLKRNFLLDRSRIMRTISEHKFGEADTSNRRLEEVLAIYAKNKTTRPNTGRMRGSLFYLETDMKEDGLNMITLPPPQEFRGDLRPAKQRPPPHHRYGRLLS